MLRKNRITWILLALTFVLAVALTACAPTSVEEVGAPTEAPLPTEAPVAEPEPIEVPEPTEEPSGEPVKIGGLAPMSAPGSVTGGAAMQAAFDIALAEINDAGGVLGRPVELVLVDTEGLPERGTAAMEKLINQDKVVAVVGEYHSAVGITAKEIAHDNHTPIIFAETWNDKITASQYPEVFRVAPLSSEVAAVDAKFISSLGVSKVVIMTENTDYGIPAAKDTTSRLNDLGIEATTFSADIGTQDFSAIIERIKAEEPGLILVLLTGETSYNFEQQAAEASIGPQEVLMICNQVADDSEAFWTNVPDGNHCFYRRIGLPRALYTPATQAFADKYTAATGKAAAESYAMEAYDTLKLMAAAIDAAGSTEADDIIAALESISYDGALGTITFPINSSNPPDAAGKDPKWWHQFPEPAITMVQYQEQGQNSANAAVVFPDTYKTADPIMPGGAAPPAAAEPSGEPVKIGGLAPMSAPGSVTGGAAMQAAFDIALAEINDAGGVLGRPVELVLVDTEGLPERGTAAMEKLINQDKVVAVVGEYHSAVGITAKEIAHDNHTPIIFAETWNDKITASQYPEVFRVAPLSSEVAAVDAKFISSLGVSKVVIMTENTDYGIPAAKDTTSRLNDLGIEATTFSADIGTQDFSAIIERIKAEEPGLILVLLTGETSYNFEQQAAEASIGPQEVLMICNQVADDSEAFWTNVPDGNHCFYRRIGLPRALYTPATQAFADKYTAATGKAAAESYAMEAYDTLKLMAAAIDAAGSTEADDIIAALESISYDGALGTITFPINSSNPPDAAGKDPKWWHQFPEPAITMVQYQEQGQNSANAAVVFPDTYKTADPIMP